jgi:hypothetical protein
MSYAIPAKYRGTCPRCGRPIDRGDWITRGEDKRWGHEDCEAAREQARYDAAAEALLAADPSLSVGEAYERVLAAESVSVDVDALISELLAGT